LALAKSGRAPKGLRKYEKQRNTLAGLVASGARILPRNP